MRKNTCKGFPAGMEKSFPIPTILKNLGHMFLIFPAHADNACFL